MTPLVRGQVNYVLSSNFEGERSEKEFLFAPYSTFSVVEMAWSEDPTYADPHRIVIKASLDNLLEKKDLPLAPWY